MPNLVHEKCQIKVSSRHRLGTLQLIQVLFRVSSPNVGFLKLFHIMTQLENSNLCSTLG